MRKKDLIFVISILIVNIILVFIPFVKLVPINNNVSMYSIIINSFNNFAILSKSNTFIPRMIIYSVVFVVYILSIILPAIFMKKNKLLLLNLLPNIIYLSVSIYFSVSMFALSYGFYISLIVSVIGIIWILNERFHFINKIADKIRTHKRKSTNSERIAELEREVADLKRKD